MSDTNYVAGDLSVANRVSAAWLNILNKLAYWGRSPVWVTSTGAADVQVITLPATSLYSAYADGDSFTFKAGYTNTGAMTLQVVGASSLAAVAVKLRGSDPGAGAVLAGQAVTVVYNSTGPVWMLVTDCTTPTTLPVVDTTSLVKGSADATKLLKIEVDGLTTATTRTWTAPDKSGTVAMTSDIPTAGAGIDITAGVVSSTIAQNSQSAAYTTVLGDRNKQILHPAADNNARTFTIDSNANVAYPIGTALTFVNKINTVTIAITSDTLTMAGTGSTGSRTLAANGMATALKIATTEWMITGTGLT